MVSKTTVNHKAFYTADNSHGVRTLAGKPRGDGENELSGMRR